MLPSWLGTGVGTRKRYEEEEEKQEVREDEWKRSGKEGGGKGKVSLEPMENEVTVLTFDYDDNLKFEIIIVVGIVLV